jgi:hypothetical protein
MWHYKIWLYGTPVKYRKRCYLIFASLNLCNDILMYWLWNCLQDLCKMLEFNKKKSWIRSLLSKNIFWNSYIDQVKHFQWKNLQKILKKHTQNKIEYEPRHDKTNIVGLRPAWIQTSLCLRAVWSGSMLFAISFSTCNRVGQRTAWNLIKLRGCAGWSGSLLVANVLCWFCRDAAHIYLLCNSNALK